MRRLLALTMLCGCAAAAPGLAPAGPIPNEVSPRGSFCIGETRHCVMLDLDVRAVRYDLGARRWGSGTSSLGAGPMLLLYATEPWASGVALHVLDQWGGDEGSYVALCPTLVLGRYLEVGYSRRLSSSPHHEVVVGLGLAWDLLSGRTMRERVADARIAEMLRASRSIAARSD